jgi:hypothetical protein
LFVSANGPSMLQSCGKSTLRQAESSQEFCAAPGGSPLKKNQPASKSVRGAAGFSTGGGGSFRDVSFALPGTAKSKNVKARAANEQAEMVFIGYLPRSIRQKPLRGKSPELWMRPLYFKSRANRLTRAGRRAGCKPLISIAQSVRR